MPMQTARWRRRTSTYATEAIHQATAAYDFAMNAQVMRVYSQMTKTLLDVQA